MIAPNLLQRSVCLELVVGDNSTRPCPVNEVPSVDLRRLGKFTVLSHVYVRS
jgi:hypothetical protein